VLKQWPAIGGGCGKAVLVLLSLFPVSCGTGIQFEARTVVASGGAVTRTTRFIAIDKKSRDEIEGRYTLPPGGVWTTEMRARKEDAKARKQPADVYRTERRCPVGGPPLYDHVRQARFSERAARNEFRVTVRNYVFMKSFAYEDRAGRGGAGRFPARLVACTSKNVG
jgi:hypothetical protein